MALKPTLKPGQKKKIDISLKVKKIKGMQEALRKANEYQQAMSQMAHPSPAFSQSIQKKITDLRSEIQKEYNILKSEIATLKQQQAKANKAASKGGGDKAAAFVKTLAKECSQVIPVFKKTKLVLLRGANNGMKAYVGRSWENRKTKDSNHKLQAVFDTYLKKQGFKALRSNSIFTTTDTHQAQEYGDLYYIFPKNGFAFHWYEAQNDLIIDDPSQVFSTDKMSILLDKASDWYEKKYKKETPDSLYQFDDYDRPDKLIAILRKIKFPNADKLTPESFIDGPGIRLDIGPTQKDFAKGLKEGGEICIAGEYYAINVYSSLARYVIKALGIKTDQVEDADDYYDDSADYDDEDGMGNPVDDGYDDL